MKKFFLTLVLMGFVFVLSSETFGQAGRAGMIRFYNDYVKADLQSATHGGISTFVASGNVDFNADLDVDGTANLDVTDIDGTLNVQGATTLQDLFNLDDKGLLLALHTVVAGDSALGRVFLDAADTTLKAGTGSDLVVIKDLAP